MIGPAPRELLAKSVRRDRPPVTLEAHSLDTERAAIELFDPARRWGRNWLRFFRLPPEHGERFLLNLRVAALLHDLGKANADFDAALRGRREVQTLRHEHLSALFLLLPQVLAWLGAGVDIDVDVIVSAVMSHHLKAGRSGDWRWCQARSEPRVSVFLDHVQSRAILARVAEVARLGAPPTLPESVWSDAPPWSTAYAEGMTRANRFARTLRTDHTRRGLLLATKAAVIAADAASSALVREGKPLDWIRDVAHREPIGAGDIARDILGPREAQITGAVGRPFVYHAFQRNVTRCGDRTLLLAACGAGKTLAAWKWAESQIVTRDVGRVVFLYPTRGTATEGFRDYVGWAPEGDAALVHGTARYELDGFTDNPSEATRGKDHGVDEADGRLFALGVWPRRYFSATVDQFLGFLEHTYTSMCLLPILADSVLVIDEVHSFDARMFDDLVSFLRAFDLPVLCMTATLPPARRAQLAEVGLTSYPSDIDRADLADLEIAETAPRYRLEASVDAEVRLRIVREAVGSGARVLWVVNQVARCQALARTLGVEALCYHSRFRLQDRQRAHAATVAAFQQRDRPALAVTTQVCEMSLDLDADLLVTELAPIPSLIQRLGRANRRLARGPDFRARVLWYPPDDPRPYERGEVADALAFAEALSGRDVDQRTLAEALANRARPEPRTEAALFLEGGYFATPGSLRDIDELSRPCVLDGDLEHARECVRDRSPYDGLVVPVPRRFVLPVDGAPSWLPRHLGTASSDFYDARVGFCAPTTGAP